MRNRGRFISVAVFAALATVVGATLSWACTPATFGTPATPAAPPTVAPPASVPSPTAGSGVGVSAPAPAAAVNPAPAPTSTGAATTTGAQSSLRTTGGVRREDRAGSKGVAAPSRPIGTGTQGTGTTVGGNSDFAQRAAGGTAGTTVRGGQSVFASSVPSKGKGKGKGKGKPGSASAPSTRSATGDLWNGFKPASRSSVFAAQSSAGKSDGNGTTAATVVAALGLGLAGLTGGLLMLGMRRRRAESRPTAGGNGTTEM